MSNKHILDGITVLDFTQYLAGPTASRVLAELGAEVIKIEWAPEGDYSRNFAEKRNGRGGFFVQHNRGKKSLCMDLNESRCIGMIKEMIPKIDVLLENYSPGAIGRMGLGWEVVHAINPGLIMCSISAFGQTGPLSARPGYDQVAQAYSGFSSMVGTPGEAPSLVGPSIGDIGTGMNAAVAINGALFHRLRSGGSGQYLDCSLLDTYHNYNDTPMEMISVSKGKVSPTRSGSHHFMLAPTGFFKSNEGFICLLAVTPKQWAGLCTAMGREDMIEDPRFQDHKERLENLDELVAVIEGWIQSLDSDEEALRLLEENRVPFAPVLSVEEAMAVPHGLERGSVRTIQDPVLGDLTIPGPPFRFSEFPDPLPVQAPFLGQHNEDILGKMLGLSPADVRQLEAEGLLASEPVPG